MRLNSIGGTVKSIWIKKIAQNCGVAVCLLCCFLANPPLYVESMGSVWCLFFLFRCSCSLVAIHIYFLGFERGVGFCFWGLVWALFGCALVVQTVTSRYVRDAILGVQNNLKNSFARFHESFQFRVIAACVDDFFPVKSDFLQSVKNLVRVLCLPFFLHCSSQVFFFGMAPLSARR